MFSWHTLDDGISMIVTIIIFNPRLPHVDGFIKRTQTGGECRAFYKEFKRCSTGTFLSSMKNVLFLANKELPRAVAGLQYN